MFADVFIVSNQINFKIQLNCLQFLSESLASVGAL